MAAYSECAESPCFYYQKKESFQEAGICIIHHMHIYLFMRIPTWVHFTTYHHPLISQVIQVFR